MTREEAIKELKRIKQGTQCDFGWNKTGLESLDVAIKALQMEPCEDAISRQEAVDELVRWGAIPDYNEAEKNILACCIGMLSSLPSVNPVPSCSELPNKCEDAISRQAVLEKAIYVPIAKVVTEDKVICRKIVFVDDIGNLSSVTPQPKMGYWYIDERPESDREIICSNCEQPIFKYHKMDFDYRPNYCPNCGAKM